MYVNSLEFCRFCLQFQIFIFVQQSMDINNMFNAQKKIYLENFGWFLFFSKASFFSVVFFSVLVLHWCIKVTHRILVRSKMDVNR